jgi:hypothetical protein
MSPPGQTADGTWEVGVRRTFPGVDVDEAWRIGLALVEGDPATGAARSRTDGEVARFVYRAPEWARDSTLQLRVLESATGATIAVHHEGLPDAAAREQMRERWTAALDGRGSAE